MFLSLCVFLSQFVCLYLCVCVFKSVCGSLSVCVFLCICVSISLSLCLFLCIFVSISLSLCLSQLPSVSLTLSVLFLFSVFLLILLLYTILPYKHRLALIYKSPASHLPSACFFLSFFITFFTSFPLHSFRWRYLISLCDLINFLSNCLPPCHFFCCSKLIANITLLASFTFMFSVANNSAHIVLLLLLYHPTPQVLRLNSIVYT